MTETKTIKPIETVVYGLKCRSRLEARTAVLFHEMGWSFEYEPEGFELPDGTWYLPDFLLHNVYLSKGFGGFQDGTERRWVGDVYVEAKGCWTLEDWEKVYGLAEAGCNVLTIEEILNPGDDWRGLYNALCRSMKEYIDSRETEFGHEASAPDYYGSKNELSSFNQSRLHCFTFLSKAELCTGCWPNCCYFHGYHPGEDMCPPKVSNHMVLCGSEFGNCPIIWKFDPEKLRSRLYLDYHDYGLGADIIDAGYLEFYMHCDQERTYAAYTAARQARFEHGETPRA